MTRGYLYSIEVPTIPSITVKIIFDEKDFKSYCQDAEDFLKVEQIKLDIEKISRTLISKYQFLLGPQNEILRYLFKRSTVNFSPVEMYFEYIRFLAVQYTHLINSKQIVEGAFLLDSSNTGVSSLLLILANRIALISSIQNQLISLLIDTGQFRYINPFIRLLIQMPIPTTAFLPQNLTTTSTSTFFSTRTEDSRKRKREDKPDIKYSPIVTLSNKKTTDSNSSESISYSPN